VKKKLIALTATVIIIVMAPLSTMAYDDGNSEPIRPYPTRTTITIEAEEDC